MVRWKRWKKDWHHRAPDFKLVYCGPKKTNKQETKDSQSKRRILETSIINDENNTVVKEAE